jgi:phosphatidylglycerophosphate synthase
MIVAKQVADFLTVLRVILAFSYPFFGLTYGADALPLAIWILLISWVTDTLDGPLARRSSRQYQTWIGDNDLGVDMIVSVGLLIYMILSGFVTPFLGGFYILFWSVYFLRSGVPRSMGMLMQAPIYFFFIWVAMAEAPDPGYWLVIYPFLITAITWPRFPNEVVPGFLEGMKQVRERSSRKVQ